MSRHQVVLLGAVRAGDACQLNANLLGEVLACDARPFQAWNPLVLAPIQKILMRVTHHKTLPATPCHFDSVIPA